MEKINFALIGCGYWGPNYIRIFNEIPICRLKYICDLDTGKTDKIIKLNPEIIAVNDYKKIVNDQEIKAVVIVTPLNTHYEITKYFLKYKKHVLVEKPFTANSIEATDLIKTAKENNMILMVGHVYKYNPGIIALKEMIEEGKFGKIYYMKAERIGLGPIRKHASALWDLATHDISIALYLLGKIPTDILIQGGYYIQKDIEDFVSLNLSFSEDVICSIFASWFAPEKIRKLTIVGSNAMAVFDDVNKAEMIKIYKHEVNIGLLDSTPVYNDHQNIVNVGSIYIPTIKKSEPLKNQVEHFIDCILKNKTPLSDGQDGLNVVKILEQAQNILTRRIKYAD